MEMDASDSDVSDEGDTANDDSCTTPVGSSASDRLLPLGMEEAAMTTGLTSSGLTANLVA